MSGMTYSFLSPAAPDFGELLGAGSSAGSSYPSGPDGAQPRPSCRTAASWFRTPLPPWTSCRTHWNSRPVGSVVSDQPWTRVHWSRASVPSTLALTPSVSAIQNVFLSLISRPSGRVDLVRHAGEGAGECHRRDAGGVGPLPRDEDHPHACARSGDGRDSAGVVRRREAAVEGRHVGAGAGRVAPQEEPIRPHERSRECVGGGWGDRAGSCPGRDDRLRCPERHPAHPLLNRWAW